MIATRPFTQCAPERYSFGASATSLPGRPAVSGQGEGIRRRRRRGEVAARGETVARVAEGEREDPCARAATNRRRAYLPGLAAVTGVEDTGLDVAAGSEEGMRRRRW